MNRVLHWLRQEAAGGDHPGMVAPKQPLPVEVRICRAKVRGTWITSILRLWRPGDTQVCRLCPTCTARNESCLLMILDRVEDEDAALYAVVGPPGDKRN